MTNEQLQYLKRILKKRGEKPTGDEPEINHNPTEEKTEQGFNPLYARKKQATPQKEYLVDDNSDQTEKLYLEFKKTGKIPGQNSDFPIRNNALYLQFMKRLKKERGE